ncbi:anti-sigma factor antagonist [candidate division KSB1 bacterium]|jgi:anti-sigma B factor antagonist|nr:anti-sigma factor antagonist [candidate division KSB1 bacterium]
MQISQNVNNDVLVLSLEGDLMGGADSEKFRKVVDQAIEEEQTNIIVDMSHVSWMNSAGLGMLISALTSLRSSGGDLRLANLNDRLRRPLQITKLDSVFQEYETVESAIKSYQ